MVDITTKYLGIKLETPIVASSSPLCKDLSSVRRLAEAGAGAIVLHSLFEEQIDAESSSGPTVVDRQLFGAPLHLNWRRVAHVPWGHRQRRRVASQHRGEGDDTDNVDRGTRRHGRHGATMHAGPQAH